MVAAGGQKNAARNGEKKSTHYTTPPHQQL
jgi:hypothetical protein